MLKCVRTGLALAFRRTTRGSAQAQSQVQSRGVAGIGRSGPCRLALAVRVGALTIGTPALRALRSAGRSSGWRAERGGQSGNGQPCLAGRSAITLQSTRTHSSRLRLTPQLLCAGHFNVVLHDEGFAVVGIPCGCFAVGAANGLLPISWPAHQLRTKARCAIGCS